ncbi:MAG TPA: hypothetical protein VK558_09130 [Patescibacteria group bacterium]|nr:hypothetical protein [Patescibacteria group bacterium]
MVYQYFVAIDTTGHAGLAATKRCAVESEALQHGDTVVPVEASNAYQARRQAAAAWEQASGSLH